MKKLMVIGLIGAVALFAIAKKTSVFSYASTFAASVESEVKGQIPTKFELDRIRNEIAGLDSDVGQMIKPIAEYKAVIEKMRRDIVKTQANIDEQKKNMLPIVEQLQTKSKEVTVGCKTYPAERVRAQLARDLDRLKQLEKHVKTQSQVLTAKETSLKATQEQLAKVITKKREYELRLAQLEAEEETLQIARIGSDIQIDNSRATVIENALASVEHKQNVARNEIEMRTGNLANLPLTTERKDGQLDLQSLRNYLEGNEETSKTASNK